MGKLKQLIKYEVTFRLKSNESETVEHASRILLKMIRTYGGQGSGPIPLPGYFGIFYPPAKELNGTSPIVHKSIRIHSRLVVGKELTSEFFTALVSVDLPTNVYLKLKEKKQRVLGLRSAVQRFLHREKQYG